MVAPTPKNVLFERNFSSNTQPLFFEFAFEPTTVNSHPPSTVSTPLRTSKRKKAFYFASKLALGLLVTAFVFGSGLLNNELLTGKSGTQASLSWIPAWSINSSTESQNVSAATLGTIETSETPSNSEAILTSTEANNAFSSTVAVFVNAEETSFFAPDAVLETGITTDAPDETEIATVTATESTSPAAKETTKKTSRPILKPPVSPTGVKLSTPVVNRETVAPKKNLEITSDAFHAINEKAALDGKKVFIKFGARWCLPCKMMEANVFPDAEISRLLADNYLTLTVDVDKIDGINLRQAFNVEAIPSFIILDNNQNLIGKYEGAKRIDELRSILGNVSP